MVTIANQIVDAISIAQAVHCVALASNRQSDMANREPPRGRSRTTSRASHSQKTAWATYTAASLTIGTSGPGPMVHHWFEGRRNRGNSEG